MKLDEYTHCTPDYAARELERNIEALEKAGYTVASAVSRRRTVPNSYKYTHGMLAPAYVWQPSTGAVLTSFPLESRPRGNDIPARFYLSEPDTKGKLPAGLRWLRKKEAIVVTT